MRGGDGRMAKRIGRQGAQVAPSDAAEQTNTATQPTSATGLTFTEAKHPHIPKGNEDAGKVLKHIFFQPLLLLTVGWLLTWFR